MRETKQSGGGPADRAGKYWRLVPLHALIVNGEITELGEEITTREAALLLGIAVRTMQSRCDQGLLREGRDWRKLPSLGPNGHYLIRRDAVLRLRRGET